MSKLSGGSEWALLVAPEPPYPIIGGGAMRTASLLHFLAARFRLHLVTFSVGERFERGDSLPAGTVERVDWVRLPHHSKSAIARIVRNSRRLLRGRLPLSDRFSDAEAVEQVARAIAGRRYALAVLEHFWCAPYLELLRPQADCVAMDMVDIESALHARCARTEPWPARLGHRAFASMAARAERRWLPEFDLVLATSETDRDRILKLAPGANVVVYPNAVPARFVEASKEDHCIAFSGNLEYHPNVGAVRFFARRVWPELRRRDAALCWRLIGRNEWAVRRLIEGDARIEATGPVEDPLAELARAKVVVVPVLAGSGTRVKILEAWAASRAVVSTRMGAEGLPAVDGENILFAESPDEMVVAVLKLLEDGSLRRRLGEGGRRVIERQLCWPAVWRNLEQALAALLPAGGIGGVPVSA